MSPLYGKDVSLSISSTALAATLLAHASVSAHGQDLNLQPTRPTVANAAAIQSPGVLQVETGYDAYPQPVPGNQQTVDTEITYTPAAKLRLDFLWSAFNHQGQGTDISNGIGDITLGGKLVLHKEDYHRPAPGLALQYEAELPTASQTAFRNYGQQAILLVNHHSLHDGILDVIANGSVVQSGCNTPTGCSYGGQQSVALSYHLQKTTRLYAEAFAQNTTQSNTPPGTYIFTGFYHAFSASFGLDGGLRFGVSNNSATIGTTVGIVFGKRLRKAPAQ